jgi:hypothetical protein
MAKVGQFLHDSFVVDDVAAIDTNYNTARVHVHNLYANTYISGNQFKDRIESIIVRLKDISVGGATSVTVRVCMDANGDYTIIPDTTATLSLGVTTATAGCAAIYYGAPIQNVIGNNDTVYLFVKVDAGTAVLDASCITWSE